MQLNLTEYLSDTGIDPNILADLQKALRHKPRVEEHFKASLSNSRTSSPFQGSSSPSRVSPVPFQIKKSVPSPPQTFRSIRDKELVDFSPSVGRTPKHPVPTSVDDGLTLDWSGTVSEDDRRDRKWSMPLRRSSREKYPHISNKVLIQKQEALYAGKYIIKFLKGYILLKLQRSSQESRTRLAPKACAKPR